MNHLLADLKQVQQRLEDLEKMIAERCGNSEEAAILATIPGVAAFTATSLACRVGRVERFPPSHACTTLDSSSSTAVARNFCTVWPRLARFWLIAFRSGSGTRYTR
ncbi:MAG: hypothetical protein ACYTG0_03525, partial [Planctomycetota bacterium]